MFIDPSSVRLSPLPLTAALHSSILSRLTWAPCSRARGLRAGSHVTPGLCTLTLGELPASPVTRVFWGTGLCQEQGEVS